MMAHTSTAEIDRSISRFISRGNEIAKHEPTTSYYCKLRATELLMETKPRPDDLIRKLLEELERQKRSKKITSHPSIDFAKVKRFALSVYDRADQRDRRKMFTKELVDAFDASAAFLYCLESQIFTPYKEQGCDFNEDLRQRAEYAEWRAYDVAVALKCGKNPTQVADALDGTSFGDGLGGEFPNIGGVSLAAAAPPPLDLPNDVPKQPEERPGPGVSQEKKDGEQSKKEKEHQQREQEVKQEEKEDEVKPKEQVQDVKNTKVEEGKKESVKNDDDKDADSVVNSRIETEKVSSPSEPPKRQETPMFNGVTSTRHGNTDWIKIESKKTSQKFWFNERTKEKTWEEPPNE